MERIFYVLKISNIFVLLVDFVNFEKGQISDDAIVKGFYYGFDSGDFLLIY